MSEFEHLGPYKTGKIIGRGGMGSVYEATHVTSGEQVAVKLIAQHVADDMRFRRRFDAEIETLRRLRHPGIVRLIGYGEEEGRLFYAMELVHGESLQQRIRDVKRMGWLPAVDIAIQITAALKHAHDIGVIHRDLKPANLLLTENNEVKLVDFGIAKLFGYGDQTLAGSVLGTADYMAPEQAGEGPITARTDLYALGSVMYAMMAGRSPFAGKKLTQVIEALKRDRAVPLELINPDIPQEVVEIVHHLLEKDPNKRPPTALSVSKRLKATRAGLQRERTVTLENELTASGTPERDNSLEDTDTQNSQLTDLSRLENPGAATAAGSDREKTDPNQPSLHRRSAAGSASIADMATAATDGPVSHKSLRSDASIHSLDFETESPLVAPTTFKTVESDEAQDGIFGRQATTTPAHHWLQIASIAGMLAILAGGVYLFVRAARTPPADAMFATLQTAEQDGELTLNESLLERFLVYYPDDKNAEQVKRWQQQAELQRTIKRMVSRAQRIGGISKLDPAAQGFYQAMQLRDSSSTEAENHLRAWLDVFAVDQSAAEPPVIEPVSMSLLTRLAQQELQRLQSNDVVPLEKDLRVERLQERIAASEQMDDETRANLLRGLIRLYGKDAWARPAVDRAAAMLAAPANPKLEDAK